ncbi:MAG: ACT domain-containing protein, partial [Thermoanaerobaculia bacterium]
FITTGVLGEGLVALAEQLGELASSVLDGSLQELKVGLWGIDEEMEAPLTVAAVKGALTPFLGETVNFVNAEHLAEGRGIEVVRSSHRQPGEYPQLIEVRLTGEGGSTEVGGTLFAATDPRVVHFDGYRLEFRLKGHLLVLRNRDVPGVVGKVGTLLGDAKVNIAEIHLARRQGGDEAMAVLRLDEELAPEVVDRLTALTEVNRVQTISLVPR